MGLDVPVVWSDDCLRHAGASGPWIGRPLEADEVPERLTRIRDSLEQAGAEIVPAVPHDDALLERVHDPGLVDFLRVAHRDWVAAGIPTDHGQPDVVGYIFATPGLLAGVDPLVPEALSARTGRWAFDTITAIGPGTWEAARAAVDVAATAADVARDRGMAYAATRPPGHHATRSAYGGSCYLNNAAVAAERLRETGAATVAILDVDAHHGNGAQAIFWERDDVRTGSVHVDPRAGWFPHFLGTEDETGTGPGAGANRNVPLPPGSGDGPWLSAVETLAGWASGCSALVVALGVDAAAGDPESPLVVTAEGFYRAGELLGQLAVPTVVVQEGGYELASVGGLVRAFCEGVVG